MQKCFENGLEPLPFLNNVEKLQFWFEEASLFHENLLNPSSQLTSFSSSL